MKEIKCPKCGATDVECIDTDFLDVELLSKEGCQGNICRCPKCHIDFGIRIDFEIKITDIDVEWIEESEED